MRYNTPFYNLKNNTVGFWGYADWKVDFTTKDNTAEFTAAAALDNSTPEILRIASFQISANEIAAIGTKVKKQGLSWFRWELWPDFLNITKTKGRTPGR